MIIQDINYLLVIEEKSCSQKVFKILKLLSIRSSV